MKPQPFFYPKVPDHPNMLRRSKYHDYTSRCFYMITMRANRHFGPLSTLAGSLTDITNPPACDLTPLGRIAAEELLNISKLNSKIKIYERVIMPDHIHFLLFVRAQIEKPISYYIGKMKSACTRHVWDSHPDHSATQAEIGLFERGFNDRIVKRKGQLDKCKHYIKDNPRRLLLRREFPDFFHNTRTIMIEGKPFQAYGNFLLLDNPVRSAVVVSSSYTPAERARYEAEWAETIRQQGVLIGAFVSEAEKKIKSDALEQGAKIIHIKAHGFGEKYKPAGIDLDFCARGQILEIGFLPFSTRKQEFSRRLCLDMNAFSRRLAES